MSARWLIEESVGRAIEAARASGAHLEAAARAYAPAAPIRSAGVITIDGVLTDKPDFFARVFGGGNTVYGELVSAIADADADPAVSEIVLAVNSSPGGSVDGLLDAMRAIRGAVKPTRALIRNQAASAAYMLVSQANEVVATNDAARFGSVGVVESVYVSEEFVDVTNAESTDKRPDPRTAEGVGAIRSELDGLFEVFAEQVAAGRGTTVDAVKTGFGRGRMFAARDALARGMIDRIGMPAQAAAKEESMDLRSEHPDVYAAAVREGVEQERDRVKAHLELGAVGDLEAARAAILDGSPVTQSTMAHHLAAGLKRRDVAALAHDNPPTLGAPDVSHSKDALAERVAEAVERAFGIGEV